MYWIWRLIESFYRNKPYLITRDWYLGYKFWYPADWILGDGGDSQKTAEFEGQFYPVPAKPELALSKEYENYKEFPPDCKRHGYYSIVLPMTPCFHSSAMQYKGDGKC